MSKRSLGDEEFLHSLIVATAGHVDHGKTSLVKKITGVDTDTLSEEKSRGLSINPGFAYLQLDLSLDHPSDRSKDLALDHPADRSKDLAQDLSPELSEDLTQDLTQDLSQDLSRDQAHDSSSSAGPQTGSSRCIVGFVDVPGHVDFINNMLAGVGAVEHALLVIAADDGIMPQTREHLAILNLLGIDGGAVALSKIDRCDAARIEAVSTDIDNLLRSSALRDAPIFPLSNVSGAGIPALTDYLASLARDKLSRAATHSSANFRYLIDRSFSVKGAGTIVTGTVKAGSIGVGEKVLHSGSGKTTRIKALRLDDRPIERLQERQRGALNITLEQGVIQRGDWLMNEDSFHPVQRFDASLELLDPNLTLRSSAGYHLYLGASHHIVTIRPLDSDSAERRFFQLKSHEPLVAHYGDKFILRDPASEHTIGGGRVIDIFVPRRGRGSAQRLAYLAAADAELGQALNQLLELLPGGVDMDRFKINRNLSTDMTEQLIASCTTSTTPGCRALKVEKQRFPVLLQEAFFAGYRSQITEYLKEFHSKQPQEQGLGEPALSEAVDFPASHHLFHALLLSLEAESAIQRSGTLMHIPGHSSKLSRELEQFLAKIKPLLISAGNVPPRTRELVDLTGIPLKPLERILRETTKTGSLVQVSHNRHFLPDTVIELADFTEQLARESDGDEGFSVIQFRDASGIGRNLCIEILEYFDRIGFTRRDGNTRFLRTDKENIFRK